MAPLIMVPWIVVQLVGYNRSDKSHHTGSFVIHGIPRGIIYFIYRLWEITLAAWQMFRRLLLYEASINLL